MREQWGTRLGFIMAAVGSAIGLGNIWRFPYIAYDNGGGAFFLPYLIALLTAGIPILIMEFTLGHKYRGSSPFTWFKVGGKKSEWFGWWQVAIAFVISTYYAAIIGWALAFAFFSIKKSWGDHPETFLTKNYLHTADPGSFGGWEPGVIIPLIIIWLIALFILGKGVKKGIEVANRIIIPVLIIIFILLAIRAVTLPGAAQGLEQFFAPDWSQIFSGSVWIAAYSQIFFSMSIAFAIMITYSSYLPKKSDINNNAFITGFSNSGFELLAGIAVFSALGFMAQATGANVEDVVNSGVGLAFSVFPAIINQMPVLSNLFGVLFFLALALAGLTSLISISQTYISGLQEKFNLSHGKAVTFGGGLAALISLGVFASKGGLNFLDVVDHFVLSMGTSFTGLIEVILIAWVFRQLTNLQKHTNEVSDIIIGGWWKICLGVITPILIGIMLIFRIKDDISQPYYGGGDYPLTFLIWSGWAALAATVVVGILLSVKKWHKRTLEKDRG